MSIRSRLTPVWPGERGPAVAMLAGFAALAGLFPAAKTEGLRGGHQGFAGLGLSRGDSVPNLTRGLEARLKTSPRLMDDLEAIKNQS